MPPPSSPPGSTSPDPETVTLVCPHCEGTLRTEAAVSIDGPCPLCGATLQYQAPTRSAPGPFVPRQRVADANEPDFEKPKPAPADHPKPMLSPGTRRFLRRADEFFFTRTGRALSCFAIGLLIFICVVLFFKWDQRRRLEALDAPPASAAPAANSDQPARATD